VSPLAPQTAAGIAWSIAAVILYTVFIFAVTAIDGALR
jgi:hypothetical protein